MEYTAYCVDPDCRCDHRSGVVCGRDMAEFYASRGYRVEPPLVEPFPPDVADVLDRAVSQLDSHRELDAEGRYVRGTFAGMTPAEVMEDREAFRRATE